jgi:hypothetical protein
MNAHKWCAVLCVAGSSLLAVAAEAQPQPQPLRPPPRGNCLALRDLDQLHAVSGNSAVATTRRDAYMITFRNYCQAMASGAYFILRAPPIGLCLDRGDRLDVSVPAPPCIIESITYLRSVRLTNGR